MMQSRILSCAAAVALLLAGCRGGSGSKTSHAAIAARSAVDTMWFRSVMGTYLFNGGVSGNFAVSDTGDPTNATPLYVTVVVNPDGSSQNSYFTDAARTLASGTTQVSAPQAGSGAGVQVQQLHFTNVGTAMMTGTFVQTKDSSGNVTLQTTNMTLNANGTTLVFNGTVKGVLGTSASSNPTLTLSASTGLTVTDAGQQTTLSISSITDTFLATSTNDFITGALSMNPAESLGDTGTVQFNADGSAQATLYDNTSRHLVNVTVDQLGNTNVYVFNPDGTFDESVSIGVLKAIDPDGISV